MANAHLRCCRSGITRLFTVLSLLAVGQSFAAQGKEDHVFHWHSAIASGKTVVVHGVNGSINASLSPSSELQVEATETGPGSDQVKVALSENAEGILICLVREGEKLVKPCGSASLPKDVRVDFKLQLPAGVAFVASNLNGAVRASSVQSRVDATTINGDIDISTTETITSARTGNGSLDLAMGKLWTGSLSIKTQNGNIRLKLPRNVVFQPSGSGDTVITGSGPVQLKGLAVTQAGGKTNGAAPQLEISTLHGNVTISTQD
jgi:putative adhesin